MMVAEWIKRKNIGIWKIKRHMLIFYLIFKMDHN